LLDQEIIPNVLVPMSAVIPNMGYFLAGALIAKLPASLVTGRLAAIAACVTLIASQTPPLLLFILPFTLPVLVLWLAYTPRVNLHHWADGKGDLSYGIYLYGFPIQQLLINYVPAFRHTASLFASSLLLTLPLALTSWHLIEHPAMEFYRNARKKK
jgi:peptidoglycan/LPS O-acetylase OafA/YrhL